MHVLHRHTSSGQSSKLRLNCLFSPAAASPGRQFCCRCARINPIDPAQFPVPPIHPPLTRVRSSMFKLFSNDHAASISEDCSTNNLPKKTLPGGPAPDSALSWHNEPINRQHPGPASEEASAAPCPPPRHPSRRLSMANTSSSHQHGQSPSDAHRENGPAVANADGAAMEGLVGGEARRMASVASRRTDRSRSRAIDRASGDDAFVYGAATVVNEIPIVDPSLQYRATGAEEDLGRREKAAISKEERALSLPLRSRPSVLAQ